VTTRRRLLAHGGFCWGGLVFVGVCGFLWANPAKVPAPGDKVDTRLSLRFWNTNQRTVLRLRNPRKESAQPVNCFRK